MDAPTRYLNPWKAGPDPDILPPDDGGRTQAMADAKTVEEVRAVVTKHDGITTSDQPIDITKLGNNRKRKNQLVARLKRRRHYAAPLRGGRGKQARTRRKKFG